MTLGSYDTFYNNSVCGIQYIYLQLKNKIYTMSPTFTALGSYSTVIKFAFAFKHTR